jgi:hypothetical protein
VFAIKAIIDMQIAVLDIGETTLERTPTLIADARQISSAFGTLTDAPPCACSSTSTVCNSTLLDKATISQDLAELLLLTAELMQSWQRSVRLARVTHKKDDHRSDKLIAPMSTCAAVQDDLQWSPLPTTPDNTQIQDSSISTDTTLPVLHQYLDASFLSEFSAADDILALLGDPLMY